MAVDLLDTCHCSWRRNHSFFRLPGRNIPSHITRKAQTDLDADRTPSQIFGRAISRAIRLLFTSPTVAILSIYVGIVYGFMYLLFTTFPLVFQIQYGFDTGEIGLTYLGLGIGSIIGLGVTGFATDKIYRKKSVQGPVKPEYRILPLVPGALFIPVGLFWYGWSADYKTHWIVPEIGTVFVGIGISKYRCAMCT
jgi:hypothetical protein